MARTKIELDVELESGETFRVVADQRDLAALEAQDRPEFALKYTQARFMAWNAAHRSKRYTGTWEQFNTVDALEVGSPEAEEPEPDDEAGEDGLDPGRTGQSASA
jgi:hypothetical protein